MATSTAAPTEKQGHHGKSQRGQQKESDSSIGTFCNDSASPETSDLNALSDIEYVYLNFDTEIATLPVFPVPHQEAYPECPSLIEYENPFRWSKTRKNLVTWVSCATSIIAAYSAGAYAAPAEQLTQLWDISRVKYTLGVSVYAFGFGIAPMISAPFSEINGRRPVFIASGILFVVCQLGCALTSSFGGMIAARMLAGIGGSTFSTMVGGILADIWTSEERNTAMVLFTGASMFGTGLGPLLSSIAAQHLLWRWVFYIQLIVSTFLVGLVIVSFKETRGPILLARKAKALNKWYDTLEELGALGMQKSSRTESSYHDVCRDGKGQSPTAVRVRYKVLAEEERVSVWRMLSVALTRPTTLLFTEPILICFALWMSFSWAILYLQFGAIPLVFETSYGFTLEQAGAVFAALCVGGILSTVLSIYQDKWAVKKFGVKFTSSPEGRLWFTCAEGLLMPIGMLWFGWTCYGSIHWIVPSLALVAVTMGIFSIFLATFNYTADVYQTYASSGLAAIGVCRNLMGGGFPLVTVQMFNSMGFQAASSLLGGIAFLLALGPILLIWFGPRIRLRSKVARQFVSSDEA